jgi:hypothetical protein
MLEAGGWRLEKMIAVSLIYIATHVFLEHPYNQMKIAANSQ